MLQPLITVALVTLASASVIALQQSVPERSCVELVAAAKDQPLREGTFGVYKRCRQQGLHGGTLESGCRELARLYSVARHYKDASGSKLGAEEFCATAVGSALGQGPMQELDACVAGAEEVLSSSEVSEAAETACRRLHPKAGEAPAACRQYVVSLAEALHRTPAGELVDAESICGKLVEQQGAQAHQDTVVASSLTESVSNAEEQKFVSSCVQFAGNLMNNPGIGEDQVRKSCEAHLGSDEQVFCSGYTRLVTQRADASDFSSFCVAEYRRMSITAKPPSTIVAHVQQAKKASSMAMNMPALCARLFDHAVSASLSMPELRRTADDLCTQELSSLAAPLRPEPTRIRVGCKFFAHRLVQMKEQQGTTTSSQAFCAHIATPQRATIKAVTRSSPIAVHGPAALLAPTPGITKPSPQAMLSPAPIQAMPVTQAPLPVLSASAALPALAAAATAVVPQPAGPEEVAKAKSDEEFLSKFLNKYEATNAGATEAPAAIITAQPAQPQIKVFRDDEMAEVRAKAEQLFGSDVEVADPSAAPAVAVAAPVATVEAIISSAPAAFLAAPAATVVAVAQPVTAVLPAEPPAVAAKAASSSEATSLLSLGGGNQEVGDFLSSFLSTYTGNADSASKAQPANPSVAPAAVQAAVPPSALALLESPVAISPSEPLDVDSMVSAFLSRSGN